MVTFLSCGVYLALLLNEPSPCYAVVCAQQASRTSTRYVYHSNCMTLRTVVVVVAEHTMLEKNVVEPPQEAVLNGVSVPGTGCAASLSDF